MAQVAPTTDQQSDVDFALRYEWISWSSIPEYQEWWSEMDADEKAAFELEWAGITEHWLRELVCWAAQGLLNPEQCARYDELQALIARHRPTLEAMLAS